MIERAVGAHLEVHRTGQPGGESGNAVAIGRVQHPDPAPAVISKEIDAGVLRWKLGHRRIVKRPARNGAPVGVRVLENGIMETRVGLTARAFAGWPAVVGSGRAVVDFLPGILADVVDEDPSRPRLEGEGERVAQALCTPFTFSFQSG